MSIQIPDPKDIFTIVFQENIDLIVNTIIKNQCKKRVMIESSSMRNPVTAVEAMKLKGYELKYTKPNVSEGVRYGGGFIEYFAPKD